MNKSRIYLFPVMALALASCAGPAPSRDVVSQRYVHKYGLEVAMDDWQSRGQDGQVITTLKNGVKVTKNFNHGKLDGDATFTFPHSDTIERVETYTAGNLVKERVNGENGWPQEEVRYQGGDRIEKTLWFDTGAPRSVEVFEGDLLLSGEYYTTSNQLESRVTNGDGLRIVRDLYGVHEKNERIENGTVTAVLTYHPNGVLASETPYINGLIDGVRQTYNPSGEPQSTESWTAGRQQGLSVVYKNGQVWKEIPYVDGVKNGVEKTYRGGHEIVEETTWFNDKKHGPSRSYVEGLVSTKWYYMDQVMPKSKHDQLMQSR